jgi:hypothetical protein
MIDSSNSKDYGNALKTYPLFNCSVYRLLMFAGIFVGTSIEPPTEPPKIEPPGSIHIDNPLCLRGDLP